MDTISVGAELSAADFRTLRNNELSLVGWELLERSKLKLMVNVKKVGAKASSVLDVIEMGLEEGSIQVLVEAKTGAEVVLDVRGPEAWFSLIMPQLPEDGGREQ